MTDVSAGRHYDDVVVGSSPLMLLQAFKLAAAGRRVCVVERLARIGGVWRTAPIGDDDEVEIACHLVEDFPGVYEHLEAVSGIPFLELDNQPIRVLKSGRIVRYSSRTTIVLGAIWAFAQLMRYHIGRAFGPQSEEQVERSYVLVRKLRDVFSFLLPIVWSGSTIRAPERGFAAFISALHERCRNAGVCFVQADVKSISRTPDGSWCLESRQGANLSAARVHCTTSANLTRASAGVFESVAAPEATSRSIVVEVPFADVMNRVSYAAFWDDPNIIRISRIDQHPPRQTGLLYLIQLRRGVSIAGDALERLVRDGLTRAGVISSRAAARIVGNLECSYVPHRRQLPDGEIAPGFYGYSSAGNLASGAARWLSRA